MVLRRGKRQTATRVGILTSGGDCAGLNAVIRAAVFRAISHYGWEVLGIVDGTLGLMDDPPRVIPLDLSRFTGAVLRLGGTMLGTTNKGDPFAFPMSDGTVKDRSGDFVRGCKALGLDALVVIGGDGSLNIVSRLCDAAQMPMVGIPKTIDNDVALTDSAVGFATAVDVCVEALDRLQPTAASHHRVMVLEVMGRTVGHIALAAGVGGGADAILLPEIPFALDGLVEKLRAVHALRRHSLVVVAEGVDPACLGGETASLVQDPRVPGGIGHYLAAVLGPALKADARVTVLGHVQRGGAPNAQDRMLASAFGSRAVDLLADGQTGRMVAWQGDRLTDVAIREVVRQGTRPVHPDSPWVQTARRLDIYMGD